MSRLQLQFYLFHIYTIIITILDSYSIIGHLHKNFFQKTFQEIFIFFLLFTIFTKRIQNKMELLQSQAPAERELLGNSAVRTLDIGV